MRMQLLKIVLVLLIAGSGDTRPQNGADSQAKMVERNDAGWRGIQVSSKSHDIVRDDSSGQLNDTRNLKDLQYMDQSLRTVATQLLNVTNPQDVMKVNNKELIKAEHNIVTTPKSSEKNNVPLLIRDVSSEISNLEPVSFGRPINSKFSYFETSHPGQAMAITEEELEREMSTTRLITAYKNHPTTTGGISTWILLNPPSTTEKSAEIEKTKTQQPFQTEVRLTVRPSSPVEKVETIPQSEKIAEKSTLQLTPVITTEKVTVITKKPTATTMKKISTTLKPEKITQDSEKTETSSSTTLKVIRTTTTSTSTTSDGTTTLTTVLTTKKSQSPRTTSKPKVTTPKITSHSKPTTMKPTTITMKPTTKPTRSKPTRKTTVKSETVKKNETFASTGKIEKVTFKPVPIITTPQNKPENTEKPMFVTKIKASVLMDTQKTSATLLPATTATTLSASTLKPNLSSVDLMEVPVRSKPIATKGNNVLKVQLKKPVDATTQIEIEPIKMNAPILKIEKVDKNKMDEIMMKDTDDLSDSRIDLKFDFNPELTKINVETQTEIATTSTITTASTTTKRPRHNSKRKKNKTRRRKPTTVSVPSSTVAMMPILMETSDSVTDSTIMDNAVQESKIAPETKIGVNTTKTKKKQPQKGISTQIYNFLSREVMPSFGVMSLVGLGLGLASYFLYPFGGTITRRNYDVEPNYKYNMDEYGGNYGQSEEEMLSKVFQGMTNYENKYPGAKDNYNDNYYHYQHYDGAYDAQTTKKIDAKYPSVSTSSVYKTAENTQPAVKYRNTDFRYPEAQTTPVYYDRKRPDLVAEVGVSSAVNRQFVVGNVPKEYPFDVNLPVDNKKGVGYMSTEVGQTPFERDVSQNFDFPNAVGLHSYSHLGASTIRSDDGYEEIEITPTAVAVEHGPRALKVKRAALDEAEGGQRQRLRSKRESVIQIIPSKRELEEEREEAEKEEDLSNEILDIIDSALPGGGVPHKRGSGENNEVEDLEGQKRKQQEEVNKHIKESILKTTIKYTEDTTEITTSSTTVRKMDDGDTNVSSENSAGKDTTHPVDPKNPEVTTVEWFDSSTTKPSEGFSLLNFVKKVAEIKFRLGLTILKHASEGFARYLGHVQKRINGEE